MEMQCSILNNPRPTFKLATIVELLAIGPKIVPNLDVQILRK